MAPTLIRNHVLLVHTCTGKHPFCEVSLKLICLKAMYIMLQLSENRTQGFTDGDKKYQGLHSTKIIKTEVADSMDP